MKIDMSAERVIPLPPERVAEYAMDWRHDADWTQGIRTTPVVTGEYRLGDVRHITADSSRLRAELGWKPEIGFDEGMREFARSGMRGS